MARGIELDAATQHDHPVRRRTYQILEVWTPGDRASQFADIALIALVAANILAVIFQSIASVGLRYADFFRTFEILSVSVFSLEFVLRLWASAENHYRHLGPWRARLRYLASPLALADFASIAPFYLAALPNVDLRFLRIMRLLRIFKLTRYFPALASFARVIHLQRAALATAFGLMILVLIFAASAIYVVEHEAQPRAFASIPASMWWAVATLTTVGYGDVTPITPLGQFLSAIIMLAGIGMVALPTSILASGFATLHRRNQRLLQMSAREALEDGQVSEDEALAYARLAEELGVDEHDAQTILEVARHSLALREPSECPHCGETIG